MNRKNDLAVLKEPLMSNTFTISWPVWGKSIEAELFDQQEVGLCAAFWDSMPSKSIQSHASCAGFQIYCPYKLAYPPSNPFYEPMNEQKAGRINLELDFQYLSINYSSMEEPVPALPIAQVKERFLKEIETIGKMAWDNLLFSSEFIEVNFQKSE